MKRLNVPGEICLLGGTAMVLAFQAHGRPLRCRRDLCAYVTIRNAVRLVAAELSLPEDWLNDAAKGLASEKKTFERLTGFAFENLRAWQSGNWLAASVV